MTTIFYNSRFSFDDYPPEVIEELTSQVFDEIGEEYARSEFEAEIDEANAWTGSDLRSLGWEDVKATDAVRNTDISVIDTIFDLAIITYAETESNWLQSITSVLSQVIDARDEKFYDYLFE